MKSKEPPCPSGGIHISGSVSFGKTGLPRWFPHGPPSCRSPGHRAAGSGRSGRRSCPGTREQVKMLLHRVFQLLRFLISHVLHSYHGSNKKDCQAAISQPDSPLELVPAHCGTVILPRCPPQSAPKMRAASILGQRIFHSPSSSWSRCSPRRSAGQSPPSWRPHSP